MSIGDLAVQISYATARSLLREVAGVLQDVSDVCLLINFLSELSIWLKSRNRESPIMGCSAKGRMLE